MSNRFITAPSDMGLPPCIRPGSPGDTETPRSPVSGGERVPHVKSPLIAPEVTASGFMGKGGSELIGVGTSGMTGSQLAARVRGSSEVRSRSPSVSSERVRVAQETDARVQSWVEASAGLTRGTAVAEVPSVPPVVGDLYDASTLSCSK